MKKILFFIESLSRGGAEKVLSDIVSNLDKNKYDVTVYTVTDCGEYQPVVEKYCNYGSFLHMSEAGRNAFNKLFFRVKTHLLYKLPVKLVYRWQIKGSYDVEIAFVEGFATKLIAGSPNAASKKIAWLHTDMTKNPYADKCYKNLSAHNAVYQKYDRILCVSESVKQAFETKFFSSDKISVQYNVIDTVNIVKSSREKTDIEAPEGIRLFSVGRLEEAKGFLRLTDMLGRLFAEGYRFSLWLIGDGSQRKQIEEIINKYQMGECVKLLGFHKNPYKYIGKCDAFICSSYAEGFSNSATEALILEKPVFTTECAGMRELFGDENCGEIVPNNDEALFDLLRRLVSGEIHLEQYRDALQRRKKFFDISRRIEEIEGILDE